MERWGLTAGLLAVCLGAGCEPDVPPLMQVRLLWLVPIEDRPAPGKVFMHVTLTGASGNVNRVQPYQTDVALQLDGVLPGPGRRLDIDFRTTEDPASPSCCAGRSPEFDLVLGKTRILDVTIEVTPQLATDQSAVSFVRSPVGRDVPMPLSAGESIPAGPFFGLAPADGFGSPDAVAATAFPTVGGVRPSAIEVLDESGRVRAELRPDAEGNWPRAQMDLGRDEPQRVSLRPRLSDGRVGPSVPVRRTWYVWTSREAALPARSSLVSTPPDAPPARADASPMAQDRAGAADGVRASATVLSWAAFGQPSGRAYHAAAYDQRRRRLVMFGGLDGSTVLDETWERREDGSWLRVPTNPTPLARTDHAMAYDARRGRVVMFGGAFRGGVNLQDTWEWDGQTWIQLETEVAPAPRSSHLMGWDGERVILYGGRRPDGSYSDGTWGWDGSSWTLLDEGGLPGQLQSAAAAYGDGRLVLFGGYKAPDFRPVDETWIWDGTSWSPGPSSGPSWRYEAGMTYDQRRGRFVLFGGFEPTGPTPSVWSFDGLSWTEVVAPSGPPPRSAPVVVYDGARERTVVFGGFGLDAFSELGDTWEWDGTAWEEAPSSAAEPGLRGQHQMASDGEKVVLFGGGSIFAPTNDTWTWSAGTWRRVPTAVSPSSRADGALAFDGRRFILFGGVGLGGLGNLVSYGDTWAFEDDRWTRLSPAASPGARNAHAMSYDPGLDRIVLHGGYDGVRQLADTWLWDGEEWSSTAAGPTPRSSHTLAYDGSRTIAFGGAPSGEGLLDDVWAFDGLAWTQLEVSLLPEARQQHAAVFTGERMLLFGGFVQDDDVWSWDGSEWSRRRPASVLPARAEAQMVQVGSDIVLYGGQAVFAGEQDGSMWLLDATQGRVAELNGPAAPYPSRSALRFEVEAHCTTGAGEPASLWIWDGETWHQRGIGASPIEAVLEGDAARSVLRDDGVSIQCRSPRPSVSVDVDYIEIRALFELD